MRIGGSCLRNDEKSLFLSFLFCVFSCLIAWQMRLYLNTPTSSCGKGLIIIVGKVGAPDVRLTRHPWQSCWATQGIKRGRLGYDRLSSPTMSSSPPLMCPSLSLVPRPRIYSRHHFSEKRNNSVGPGQTTRRSSPRDIMTWLYWSELELRFHNTASSEHNAHRPWASPKACWLHDSSDRTYWAKHVPYHALPRNVFVGPSFLTGFTLHSHGPTTTHMLKKSKKLMYMRREGIQQVFPTRDGLEILGARGESKTRGP